MDGPSEHAMPFLSELIGACSTHQWRGAHVVVSVYVQAASNMFVLQSSMLRRAVV